MFKIFAIDDSGEKYYSRIYILEIKITVSGLIRDERLLIIIVNNTPLRYEFNQIGKIKILSEPKFIAQ